MDFVIEGNGAKATYSIVDLTEQELCRVAMREGVECYYCSSDTLTHTDRCDGDARFCCGAQDEDHVGCPVCGVCAGCGERADRYDDSAGEYRCENCARADDDDEGEGDPTEARDCPRKDDDGDCKGDGALTVCDDCLDGINTKEEGRDAELVCAACCANVCTKKKLGTIMQDGSIRRDGDYAQIDSRDSDDDADDSDDGDGEDAERAAEPDDPDASYEREAEALRRQGGR